MNFSKILHTMTLYFPMKPNLLLLCKQAAKIFQTICKKETALKRVLRNLLSAISFAQI